MFARSRVRRIAVRESVLMALALATGACGTNGLGTDLGETSVVATHIVSGNEQVRLPGSVLIQELELQAVDASGVPAPEQGIAVTWAVTSGGGTIEDADSFTDASGAARARWRLGPTLGDQALDAAVGATPTVTFTARAVELGPILFTSDRAAGQQNVFLPWRRTHVFAMNPEGGDVVQITADSAQDSNPMRSPDGSTILFERTYEESGPSTLLLLSVADLTETLFPYQDEGSTGFTWSPDGTKLAFERVADYGCGQPAANIWTMDADGSNPTQLTNVTCGVLRREARYAEWSPDGSSIAYNDRDGVEGTGQVGHTVWIMAADGSDQTRISIGPGRVPIWLPDNKRVVVGGHILWDTSSLRILDTATGVEEVVLEPTGASAVLPEAVSPDGRFALVALAGREFGGIVRVDLVSGEPVPLTSRGDPLYDGDTSWWWGAP